MKLLIVDDEIEIIEGLLSGIVWDDLGFDEVLSCTSIQKAKEYFGEKQIDILLCDIEMPHGSGLELIEWIRENGKDTECLLLTAHEKFSYVQQALHLGSVEYLLKPMIYSELQAILQKVMKRVEEKNIRAQYEKRGEEAVAALVENVGTEERRGAEIVKQVKKYVRDHISEDLMAEDIAKEVYVGTNYLSKVFKKEEDVTLTEFITGERMFLTAELLKNPDVTVSYVASSVGYNNYTYFIKIFKRTYGITPSEYHRKYIKK